MDSQEDLNEIGRCEDCAENVFTCRHCNNESHIDDMIDTTMCEYCGSICEGCNNVYVNDEIRGECECHYNICDNCAVVCEDCSVVMCNDCRNHCENCNYMVCNEHHTSCDECGEFICTTCYSDSHDCEPEEDDSYVNEYDDPDDGEYEYEWNPIPIFLPEAHTNLYGHMGIELEFESVGSIQDAIKRVRNVTQLLYFKPDGSLRNGIEMVSHPMTFDYHANEFIWPEVMGLVANDLQAQESCGMHVHISRGMMNDENEDRLIEMLYNLKRPLIKLSQRRERNLNSWASWNVDSESPLTEDTIRNAKSSGRYRALNFRNRNTLEFRFWSGTNDVESVLSRLDIIDTMARIAMGTESVPETWEEFARQLTREDSVVHSTKILEGLRRLS